MDAGIPIPLDGLMNSNEFVSPDRRRKRSLDQDDREYRIPKGPRLNDDGPLQRYDRGDRGSWGRGERGGRMAIQGRADYMDGGMNGAMDMAMNGGMDGRGSYRPPGRGRGICRDYHSEFARCCCCINSLTRADNGYCARGAFCKYSHGEDAFVPGQLFGMAGGYPPIVPGANVPFPMTGMMNSQYNPHERIDMQQIPGASMHMSGGRPQGSRPPVIRRQGDANGTFGGKPGELPVIQDLTPGVPGENDTNPMSNGLVGDSLPQHPADVDMSPPVTHLHDTRNGFQRGGRGGGRGGGQFADAAHIRPGRRDDKTLVVEKIPEDKLSLSSINDWFKKFGTITNVAVDPTTSKALVSFAEHQSAYTAWKSEDAVFGNRFVKVFWHRPLEGHGQLGQRMLAASANLVAKVVSKEPISQFPTSTRATSSAPPPAAPVRKSAGSSTAVSALAAKQQKLEQQIAEQKSLMAQLSSASPEEKKEIMARLRKLNEEMKPSSTPLSSVPASSTPAAKSSRGSTPRTDDQAQKERERLDQELELHSVVTATDGETDDTDELKARLAKLKAEVCHPARYH